jgi:putative endonuclease
MSSDSFYVYILASRSGVLYTGVTRDLIRRIHQHRLGLVPGFTQQYHVNRLVYFKETLSARSAFERERQIKGWSRVMKFRLIESTNAGWLDWRLIGFQRPKSRSLAALGMRCALLRWAPRRCWCRTRL